AEAAAAAEELPRLMPDDREQYLNTAALLARCAESVREDARLPEPRRSELEGAYGRRAVDLLRQAGDRGPIPGPPRPSPAPPPSPARGATTSRGPGTPGGRDLPRRRVDPRPRPRPEVREGRRESRASPKRSPPAGGRVTRSVSAGTDDRRNGAGAT